MSVVASKRDTKESKSTASERAPWTAHYPKALIVLCVFALWDLFRQLAQIHDPHFTWERVLVNIFLPNLVCLALSPLPVWLAWRSRPTTTPRVSDWAMQLVGLVINSVLGTFVMLAIHASLPPQLQIYRQVDFEVVFYMAGVCALNYGVLAITTHFFVARREAKDKTVLASRLETQLISAQLETLRSRLQPHFLFNALATIHALIAVDDPGAKQMVTLLSELLRKSLLGEKSQRTTLRQELELVDLYLEIQHIRFSNRLRVVREVSEECLDLEVPSLILQPLVENAVKHGIAPRMEPGTIWLVVRRSSGLLSLSVRNEGVAGERIPGTKDSDSTGLGLQTTAERLQQLYGSAASIKFGPASDGGWETRVEIPATSVEV